MNYIEEINEKLRMNNKEFNVGDKLSDNRFKNGTAIVKNKTNTSIEVFVKAKSNSGVDSSDWYSMDIFNRYFKKFNDEAVKTSDDDKVETSFDNDTVKTIINSLIEENKDKVTKFRNGDKSVIGFFMKNIMTKTNGRYNKKFGKDYLFEKLK